MVARRNAGDWIIGSGRHADARTENNQPALSPSARFELVFRLSREAWWLRTDGAMSVDFAASGIRVIAQGRSR